MNSLPLQALALILAGWVNRAHQEARLIREFLAALETERGRVGREEPDLAWRAWARAEAEQIDPVWCQKSAEHYAARL